MLWRPVCKFSQTSLRWAQSLFQVLLALVVTGCCEVVQPFVVTVLCELFGSDPCSSGQHKYGIAVGSYLFWLPYWLLNHLSYEESAPMGVFILSGCWDPLQHWLIWKVPQLHSLGQCDQKVVTKSHGCRCRRRQPSAGKLPLGVVLRKHCEKTSFPLVNRWFCAISFVYLKWSGLFWAPPVSFPCWYSILYRAFYLILFSCLLCIGAS